MKQFLILFCLTINFIFYDSHAQNEINQIANEICENLEAADISGTSFEIRQAMSNIVVQVYDSNQTILDKIRKTELENNPTFIDTQIERHIRKKLNISLFENCERFMELAKQSGPKLEYPDHEILVQLGSELCDYIEGLENKSYEELGKIFDEENYLTAKQNEEKIKSVYPNGIFDPNFSEDLNNYMMVNCRRYFLIAVLRYSY